MDSTTAPKIVRIHGSSILVPNKYSILLVVHLVQVMNLALLLLVPLVTSFRLQGAAVKGTVLCDGQKMRNAKIKLYDLDRNPGDSDDLLDETYSDKDGEFRVDGTTRELSDIEPVVYIYHVCNDGIRPCRRKLTLDVPKRFIHKGKPTVWYDLGMVDLAILKHEERSCDE